MSRPVSRPATTPLPRTVPFSVNTQTKVFESGAGRILCIADVRGRINTINELVEEAKADVVIHTGDFGFFENSSLERINDRTLRHLVQYSPLVSGAQRTSFLSPDVSPASIRNAITSSPTPILSEFSLLLSRNIKLAVPVYTIWGACEDVAVLEKFRTGQYEIPNLSIIDEATTRCLDIGGVKLRLLGLGGAFVSHKMFDNGEGHATIAGAAGTTWTTALQIGELVDTAQRVYDPTETRVLITHASTGKEGLLAQLALILKIDLTISASLHFRYASSYNEFSVQPNLEGFRHKLLAGKEAFEKVWENVKPQVEAVIDENQRLLLDKVLAVVERIPSNPGPAVGPTSGEDAAWKNCWNWNLCDAANGSLVLDIRNGRVSAELKSQGFNYSYRRTATPTTTAPTPQSTTSALPQQQQQLSQTKALTPAPTGPPSVRNATPVNAEVASTSPVNPSPSQPESVNGSKMNGAAIFESTRDRQQARKQQKKEREKERRKDEKDRETPGKDTPEKKDSLMSHQPRPSTSSSVPSGDGELISPAEGTGGRTPTGPPRRQRNPWTLFMKLPIPVNENELREFFQDAKDGITNVKITQGGFGRSRVAFIEFGDEEAMKAGLNKHAEKLKDQLVNVTIADDRGGDRPSDRGGFGGRGRGRGGFAQRAVAQAGLVGRHTGARRNENGENVNRPTESS
ncbi:hypothetical protein Clacol_002006 [Clathrus columnatus]|uniref:RRM domain-containing protein n=1 Tax=Clathrus columnatus TaxID=1419009 RepID=A0AAV4ZZK1_9AGAM|nr:hypothetical protein Clacol_002006 [Clathrus columnatus]